MGDVQLGPELRRGIAEWEGVGEVVGGVIVMRYGENALKVIENVKKKLEELERGLPEGVKIRTAYDRSALILRAVDNLKEKLLEESVVVALVYIIFLLHFRSSLVAIFTVPVGILISFIVMYNQWHKRQHYVFGRHRYRYRSYGRCGDSYDRKCPQAHRKG